MNRNSSGASKALFIYQAQSPSFMQNIGFLLQNFIKRRQTLVDISFEVSCNDRAITESEYLYSASHLVNKLNSR
ncbi:MAG: hypothetical protein P2A85_22070 [Microcoleus anatoxicus]|uniref:hypothetical protein n=1 Tax=Microcoleus anatoxicus TaxID=2705319 RepID=UPI0036727B14